MTVADLIAALSVLPADLPVQLLAHEWYDSSLAIVAHDPEHPKWNSTVALIAAGAGEDLYVWDARYKIYPVG